MTAHIAIWNDIAFSANDKMLIQLSYTKKVRRFQIRVQIKKIWSQFFVLFKIWSKLQPKFWNKCQKLKFTTYYRAKKQKLIPEIKNSDNFKSGSFFKFYIIYIILFNEWIWNWLIKVSSNWRPKLTTTFQLVTTVKVGLR